MALDPLPHSFADGPGNTASGAQVTANDQHLHNLISAVLPSGTILPTARATAPTGFLLCQGQAVSRATYADLFTAIGTVYGTGDGSTTFNLPDLRGRVPVGRGTHAEVDALSDNDGLPVGSRKIKHRHGKGTIHVAGGGSHDHAPTVTTGTHVAATEYFAHHGSTTGAQGTRSIGGGGAHGHSSGDMAGEVGDTSGPLDGPAYQVLNYMIRA